MKLNARQIAQVRDQTGAGPIPETHPTLPQLQDTFGDHTFYISPNGLCVWEWDNEDSGAPKAKAMVVASWANDDKTELAPHEPRPTTNVVELKLEPSSG